MKIQCYLVVNGRGSIIVRKTKPALEWNEIAILFNLNLPDVLFKRPQLEAKISVDEKLVTPVEISPDIQINTKELIEQQTGMKIDLKILPIDKEE